MTQTEALKLALEALKTERDIYREHDEDGAPEYILDAIAAIKEALMSLQDGAQPAVAEQHKQRSVSEQQEPVALEAVYETIIHWDEGGGKRSRRELARRIVSLYTTPPPVGFAVMQKPWVGLTDEDKKEYISQDFGGNRLDAMDWAEKRLKEKNNGT